MPVHTNKPLNKENVRYNVYVPKVERNRTTHLNRITRTVYLLRSQFKLPCGASSLEQMRLSGHMNTKHAAAVRSSEKRLNSAKNTNDSVIV